MLSQLLCMFGSSLRSTDGSYHGTNHGTNYESTQIPIRIQVAHVGIIAGVLRCDLASFSEVLNFIHGCVSELGILQMQLSPGLTVNVLVSSGLLRLRWTPKDTHRPVHINSHRWTLETPFMKLSFSPSLQDSPEPEHEDASEICLSEPEEEVFES
jgi:hypothetical protein